MRGRVNTDLYSGISINATTKKFPVAENESILAGDFVQYEFNNELIYTQNSLYSKSYKLSSGNFIGNLNNFITIFDEDQNIIDQLDNKYVNGSIEILQFNETTYIFASDDNHMCIVQVVNDTITLLYEYQDIMFTDIVKFSNKYIITRGSSGYLNQLYLYNCENLGNIQLVCNLCQKSGLNFEYNDGIGKLFIDPEYYRLFFSTSYYSTYSSGNKYQGTCTLYIINLNIDNYYGDYSSSTTQYVCVERQNIVGDSPSYYNYRTKGELVYIKVIDELNIQTVFIRQQGSDTSLQNLYVSYIPLTLRKYNSGLTTQYGYYFYGGVSYYNKQIQTTSYNDIVNTYNSTYVFNNVSGGIKMLLYFGLFIYYFYISDSIQDCIQLLDKVELNTSISSFAQGYVELEENTYSFNLWNYLYRFIVSIISEKAFIGKTGSVKSFYDYDNLALGVAAENGSDGDNIDVYIPVISS